MRIVSTGMACPAGFSADASCAAILAGIARFEELPYVDNSGDPIIGTMLPDLPADIACEDRLIEMLSLAVSDLLEKGYPQPLSSVPLLVGLAESTRPGGGAQFANTIKDAIERRLDVRFHPDLSRALPLGHTAGFQALEFARQLLREQHVSACVVCGVDSYINASSLAWLAEHWRLKTEEDSDGVIPGEAAAAVIVENEDNSEPKNGDAVCVTGLGFGREEVHVLSEEPLLGLGLTAATRAALDEARLEMHEFDFRLSDVTGEQYGFKELALALARSMRILREEFPIWHCCDSIGDTGAAAGVCQLVIAFHAFHSQRAPGDRAICLTSSVPGDRAVATLERSRA